jgi:hypothetical protein
MSRLPRAVFQPCLRHGFPKRLRVPPVNWRAIFGGSLRDPVSPVRGLYSAFQPLTSTDGFAAPNSAARYVAVTSRFSPGMRET